MESTNKNRLLIDAVSSARFISQKMSTRLIEKLTSLASCYDKDSLKARIYTADRIKADNRQIYYIMETINKAIDAGRKISFQYCDIDTRLQLVERNNGEPYINSPYALIKKLAGSQLLSSLQRTMEKYCTRGGERKEMRE